MLAATYSNPVWKTFSKYFQEYFKLMQYFSQLFEALRRNNLDFKY